MTGWQMMLQFFIKTISTFEEKTNTHTTPIHTVAFQGLKKS